MLLVGKLYRAGKRMVGTAGCRREELAKGRKISVSIVRGMKNCQVKHSCMGRENRPAKTQSRSGGCSGGWTAGSGCGLGKHADQAVPRCPTYPILRWRGPPNDLAGCVEVLGKLFPCSCVRPACNAAGIARRDLDSPDLVSANRLSYMGNPLACDTRRARTSSGC